MNKCPCGKKIVSYYGIRDGYTSITYGQIPEYCSKCQQKMKDILNKYLGRERREIIDRKKGR